MQIAYNGQASQYQIINGQSTSSVTHNFAVRPRQAGDYLLPAMSIKAGGKQLTSQPLRLKVLKPGAGYAEAGASATQPAFLKLLLPKTNIYLGEIITGELQYFRQGVQLADQPRLTALPADGLASAECAGIATPDSNRKCRFQCHPRHRGVDGNQDRPIERWANYCGGDHWTSATNRQRNGFDPFEMFNRGEQRQITLATDTLAIQSLPPH